MTKILDMEHVTKSYPGVVALDDVNFGCDAGEVRALLGKNGAGKSTLVKILSGAVRQDSGEIRIDGKTVDFILVREVSPKVVIRSQSAQGFEGQGHQPPGLELSMIIDTILHMNLHAGAQFSSVLMEGGLEPALAQSASLQPVGRKALHLRQ